MQSIRDNTIVKFILRNRFRKEIILIVTLKIIAIFVIWGLFFSNPLSKKLDKPALVHHYLEQTAH